MLFLTGQVLAGVCECLIGDDGHACCEKSEELKLKRPPCCTDGDCISGSDTGPSVFGNAPTRLTERDFVIVTIAAWVGGEPVNEHFDVATDSVTGESPPGPSQQLFILHHSLLI